EEKNGPPAKKGKIEKIEKKKEMECPLCTVDHKRKRRYTSVNALINHLRFNHRTTPAEAGIKFRCACGHTSACARHNSSGCSVVNFTVIHEKKMGVKCILCKTMMTSLSSYTAHLRTAHSTKIDKTGSHLLCSCGVKVVSEWTAKKHMMICDERQFRVQKVDED
ncbi:hypothetical protein PFISCL1PPCAC_21797, partial [Pristionchus fissidentatus]